jgi:hypothetical protein
MERVEYTIEDIPPDLASDALACQDACNGGAVIHALDRATHELQRKNKGTDWVNQHPVIYMFLNKLISLTSPCELLDNSQKFDESYSLCLEAAKKSSKHLHNSLDPTITK